MSAGERSFGAGIENLPAAPGCGSLSGALSAIYRPPTYGDQFVRHNEIRARNEASPSEALSGDAVTRPLQIRL